MGKLEVFLFLPVLLCCSARRIGMFDFNNRKSSRCVRNVETNLTVTDLAAAILKEDIKERIPEKVTICSTIYADADDCDFFKFKSDPNTVYSYLRKYPTWGFVDESGKVNLSVTVGGFTPKESLTVEFGVDHWFRLGMLQLSKSLR